MGGGDKRYCNYIDSLEDFVGIHLLYGHKISTETEGSGVDKEDDALGQTKGHSIHLTVLLALPDMDKQISSYLLSKHYYISWCWIIHTCLTEVIIETTHFYPIYRIIFNECIDEEDDTLGKSKGHSIHPTVDLALPDMDKQYSWYLLSKHLSIPVEQYTFL